MIQNDEMKALRAAKIAAATLVSTEQSIRERYNGLVKERLAVDETQPALDEVVTNMRRLVDEAAEQWASRHAVEVVRVIGGYREAYGSIGTPDRVVAPSLPRNRYGHERDSLGLDDLCGLAPELMKARLDAVIRRSGANFGLPIEARTARLAELDAKIADTTEQHTELVDGAAEVGITLPLLDPIREQRDAVARRERRERELAAERAAGLSPVVHA